MLVPSWVININKHDRYLEELCSNLKDQYDHVYTNLPLYSDKNRPIGEIDLLCIKGEQADIYEVKCSYRIVKAKKQLKRIKRFFGSNNLFKNVRTFFYCGESSKLELVVN
jgi:hypothetical protein